MKPARRTLREYLTPAQWRQFKEENFFEVRSRSGNVYNIRWGYSGNIVVVHSDWLSTGTTLCCHPRHLNADAEGTRLVSGIPLFVVECMVTQKLLIEHDEKRFLEVANIHHARRMSSPW